jgi:hypothetical protein
MMRKYEPPRAQRGRIEVEVKVDRAFEVTATISSPLRTSTPDMRGQS